MNPSQTLSTEATDNASQPPTALSTRRPPSAKRPYHL